LVFLVRIFIPVWLHTAETDQVHIEEWRPYSKDVSCTNFSAKGKQLILQLPQWYPGWLSCYCLSIHIRLRFWLQ